MNNNFPKACAAAEPTHGDTSPDSFHDQDQFITSMNIKKIPYERIQKVATVLDFSEEDK